MFNNEKGFTLIEMLIVLLIISVLLIITIPNLTKNSDTVRDKGCEALEKLAEAQMQAYYIEKEQMPSLDDLTNDGYLEDIKCPNGKKLVIGADGKITAD